MQNLTDQEITTLKDALFKWLGSSDLPTWATAANALIKIGEISSQEAQSETLKYMRAAMQVIEKEDTKQK